MRESARMTFTQRYHYLPCIHANKNLLYPPSCDTFIRCFSWHFHPLTTISSSMAVFHAISRSRVQILLEATLRNNLRQVVHTYVPLSPSSITWYRPKGGDAMRLAR